MIVFVRYVINSARAAKTDDPLHDQRVVYLSVRLHVCGMGILILDNCMKVGWSQRKRAIPLSKVSIYFRSFGYDY